MRLHGQKADLNNERYNTPFEIVNTQDGGDSYLPKNYQTRRVQLTTIVAYTKRKRVSRGKPTIENAWVFGTTEKMVKRGADPSDKLKTDKENGEIQEEGKTTTKKLPKAPHQTTPTTPQSG